MAKKLESNLKNMILSLFFISMIMSAALGFVYNLTKGPIENANKQAEAKAVKDVLPAFDNDPIAEKQIIEGLTLYPAKKDGNFIGCAINTFTDKGFSGRFTLMVGILADNNINNIVVLEQNETPGLGDKMKEPKFKDQFAKKNPNSMNMSVKKDGGEVDAIAASTITSRAFCDAILRAYDSFNKYATSGSPVNSVNSDTTKVKGVQ